MVGLSLTFLTKIKVSTDSTFVSNPNNRIALAFITNDVIMNNFKRGLGLVKFKFRLFHEKLTLREHLLLDFGHQLRDHPAKFFRNGII